MLVIKEKFEYTTPFKIVFLCGSHFSRKDKHDKRIILSNYIETNLQNNYTVILEDNFTFAKTSKNYLSYDEIFLKGLAQVEQLASLYADKIIIVHESISTAAELGMFAINPLLADRILILSPDEGSIESEKISGFIKLAFLKEEAPENHVHLVRYYPDVALQRYSPYTGEYYAYFHNDQIGSNLGKSLHTFLHISEPPHSLIFRKSRFSKASNDPHIVDYTISEEMKSILLEIHIEALKIHLLALLEQDFVRKELRKEQMISLHVNFLCKTYKNILKNTVSLLTGVDTSDFSISVHLKETSCKLNQAIGYFIYMLQSAKLIKLISSTKQNPTVRKFQFSLELNEYKRTIGNIIFDSALTEYGGLDI